MKKLAIHNSDFGFHSEWVKYCRENNILFKLVNCYSYDIVFQLKDCFALMWHINHLNPKDILFAKQLIFSLQHAGYRVFPDFNTVWHFDDKLGQKYLFESLNIPHVNTFIFFEKKVALEWVESVSFPIVFKLRRGAGSLNVKLVKSKKQAINLINTAFNSGFRQYEKLSNLQERWKKFIDGKTDIVDVIKGVFRFGYEPEFSKTIGYDRGYIYFQEFIPNNLYDTRIIVIGNKAYGMQRYVRKGDFRASGSEHFSYHPFSKEMLKIAFNTASTLKLQIAAFDFLIHCNKPLIIELSYAFGTKGSGRSLGYWDNNLIWHEGPFNPYGWMVELMLQKNNN